MGMTVLAFAKDSVIYCGNFGMADYNRGIPITDSTVFRIASISKSVTATAFMMLYDQGLVGLDDDISEILEFNITNPHYQSDPITPRMLLGHTSSLRDGSGYNSFLSATYNNTIPPHLSSLLVPGGAYYTSNIWSTNPVGYFTYANINYGVLATVIEKISGQRFDFFVRENIFEPLGMTASFNIHDLPNPDNVAVLYRKQGGNWVPQADNYNGVFPPPRDLSAYTPGNNGFIFGPQGGLRVSARDLAKFMHVHINGGSYQNVRIVNDTIIDRMHASHWKINGCNGNTYGGLFMSWGLGVHLATAIPGNDVVFPGMEMVGHPGEAYGLISDMYFNRNERQGVIFITNGSAYSYSTGNNSMFYTVEEDVFTLLKDSVIDPFLTPQYAIEISVEGEGTLNPEPGTYSFPHNTQLQLSATPNQGWKFEKWVVDEQELLQPEIEITIIRPFVIKAVFSAMGTQIDNNKQDDKFRVFPNPGNGNFQIQNLPPSESFQLRIISTDGQEVFSGTYSNPADGENLSISTGTLPKGVYLLKIQGKSTTHTQIIIAN